MVKQVLRFGLVGLANTVIGYTIILAALAAGFGDYASNALGYAAGLLFGFALNRNWTFSPDRAPDHAQMRHQMALYVATFAVCYALNLVVLSIARASGAPSPIAQLVAMASYTASFFLLCRRVVFATPAFCITPLLSSSGFILAVVALLGAPIVAGLPVSHDVVWQMWIARQMSHGASLYIDILELNPPLWFWMALVVQKASAILGCSPMTALRLGVWFWAAISAYAVGRLWPELAKSRRTILVLFVFAMCTLMPLHDYGQREQLVLIAGLPYAFLLAARARNVRPAMWLIFAVGASAALGFALKHYFVIAPVLGELWLIARLRKNYRPLRGETATLVVFAIAYGAAVLLGAKAFLDVIVPSIGLAYSGYEVPFSQLISQPEPVIWLLSAGCFAFCGLPKDPGERSIAEVLLLSTAAFIAAYFLQQKGWHYHAIPATGMAGVAVFAALVLPRPGNRHSVQIVLPLVACALPLLLGIALGPYSNPNEKIFRSIVHGMTPGSSFLAITSRPSQEWPMVEQTGHQWPSRYFAFWMIPAIALDEADGHIDPALRRLGNEVIRGTAEDMRCHPPERLLIETRPTIPKSSAANFRTLEWFDRDPEFAQIMAHYRPITTAQPNGVYQLTSPYGPKAGDRCRAIR